MRSTLDIIRDLLELIGDDPDATLHLSVDTVADMRRVVAGSDGGRRRGDMELSRELAAKVLEIVDQGLVKGVGVPEPGKLCVEAAVVYAMGLPHGDDPSCVAPGLRRLKIGLNDSDWSSNEARAKGLRRLAIAQLGSAGALDEKEFARRCADLAIRSCVPAALRAAAKIQKAEKHRAALLNAADRCERDGGVENAYAAEAAAHAYADAAAHAAAHAAYAERDRILTLAADIAERALIELNSPGCAYLYLCEAKP
jgi:hypothetical protein